MKVLVRIIVVIMVFAPGLISAQNYGNEWIDYNRSYYKINVGSDAIYRIEYQDFLDAGVPVNSIDASKFQLHHHGVEQAIMVVNSGASQLEPGDYIEFYGIKKRGDIDSLLYQPNSLQPHNYHGLYSDSSSYFLSWITGSGVGKRMTVFKENNVSSLPAETAHSKELLEIYTDEYSVGNREFDFAMLTAFDEGEGWTGTRIQENSSNDFIISGIDSTVTTEGNPNLEMLFAGREDQTHDFRILAGPDVSSLREIGSYNFQNYQTLQAMEDLLWSDIGSDGTLVVRVEVVDNGAPLSNISVSYLRLTYPEIWDLGGGQNKLFQSLSNPSDKSYIEIENSSPNTRIFDITDRNNVSVIGFDRVGDQLQFIVPNTIPEHNILVTSDIPSIANPTLTRVSFRQIIPSNHNYILVSHPDLMAPADGFTDIVKAYSDYRASTIGGEYDTLVVSILDLFNQYSYGEPTPLSMYNFMRRMVNEGDPQYLLIIGKGLSVTYNYYRSDPSSFLYPEFVPTGGEPGSDFIFTAELNGARKEPSVATGRIPATTPDNIAAYLKKVKLREQLPFDDLRRKEILHLSGGLSLSENVQFENIVNGFKAVAEDIYLGGSVGTITKNTTDVVENINISEEVNQGLTFITFFGHSSPNVTDIDIGFVTDPSLGYNNPDKYPIFLVNGCEAGDFFENNINWGTDWLIADELGSVGMIAHSSFGFVNTLRFYSNTMYEVAFGDSTYIDQSVGDIQIEAASRYQDGGTESYINTAQVQQMVYIGDPAIKVFGTRIPDFSTDDASVFAIEPEIGSITSITEEFDLGIITKNFGAALTDSVSVSVNRIFEDGSQFQYDTLIYAPVFFEDTLIFPVDNKFDNNVGINEFQIEINPNREVEELDFSNNSATLSLLIPLTGTINQSPPNYSIVSNLNVDLIAQGADLLTTNRTYLFEFDTTINFDSPFLQQMQVQSDHLSSWEVTLQATDSTVYYWRTKFLAPLPGEEDEWVVSSFTYIDNSPSGWAQIDWDQQQNSTLNGLVTNLSNEEWEYITSSDSLFIRTFGSNHPDFTADDVEVEIDGLKYIFPGRTCRDNTINAIAFTSSTAVPYAALFEDITSPRTCGRFNQVINNYTESEVLGPENYIVQYIDAVGPNDQVVLFTIGVVNYSLWPQDIWDKLGEIGLDQVDLTSVNDGDPVIIFGKKGSTIGSAQVITADYSSMTPASEQEVTLNDFVIGAFSEGFISSTTVGPASSWGLLTTDVLTMGSGADEYSFDILGINDVNEEVALFTNVLGSVDLSSINAITYPDLRIRGRFFDELERTPPQLDKWIVTYNYPPEGILGIVSPSDQISVQEGDQISFQFEFQNISEIDFSDSLNVDYSIFNVDSRTLQEFNFRIEPVTSGDTVFFELDINTLGISGSNDISISVNIERDQLEQSFSNNLIQLPGILFIQVDDVNPVVDVTVDGEHIFDGDIISPSPIITIQVWDDNPFVSLEDTTVVDIFLKEDCEGCQNQRINFSGPSLSWTPSEGDDPFVAEYAPQSLGDAVYTLEVQARDGSGNAAGEPYKLNFEVINASTITNFYPYPNPFSSSTRFVFTLTGSDIPDEIKIQIMTIAGRVVREINQDELGSLRIGNNLTDFAWDGRDEYGDQLANGVYLYKVIVRSGGETLDLRGTSADGAFKDGIGKIYLLR